MHVAEALRDLLDSRAEATGERVIVQAELRERVREITGEYVDYRVFGRKLSPLGLSRAKIRLDSDLVVVLVCDVMMERLLDRELGAGWREQVGGGNELPEAGGVCGEEIPDGADTVEDAGAVSGRCEYHAEGDGDSQPDGPLADEADAPQSGGRCGDCGGTGYSLDPEQEACAACTGDRVDSGGGYAFETYDPFARPPKGQAPEIRINAAGSSGGANTRLYLASSSTSSILAECNIQGQNDDAKASFNGIIPLLDHEYDYFITATASNTLEVYSFRYNGIVI